MVIKLFGYTLTLEKDVFKALTGKDRHGRLRTVERGCKIAQEGPEIVLVDPDGYRLPKQCDLIVSAPMNGCATATVTLLIAGIEHEPKEWISREPKPEHFFDRVRREEKERYDAAYNNALNEKNAIHDLPDATTVKDQITERVRELTDEGMHAKREDKPLIVMSDPQPPTQHRGA